MAERITLFTLTIVQPMVFLSIDDYAHAFLSNNNNFTGKVDQVIDGFTLEVGNKLIELALVDSVDETGDPVSTEATHFTSILCPIGSPAVVQLDNNNFYNLNISSGAIAAVVYCLATTISDGNETRTSINEALLEAKLAAIDPNLCSNSQFAEEKWAQRFGC